MAKKASTSKPRSRAPVNARKKKANRSSGTTQPSENYDSSFQRIVDSLLAHLGKHPDEVAQTEIEHVINKVNAMWNFVPRVAVFGQAGAGKSTLCNGLFGRHVCEVSAVKACTMAPQEVPVELGKNRMVIVDMPGVGESRETDAQYTALYHESLKDTDLVLWLLKADSRAFSSDLHAWELVGRTIHDSGIPFLFILTQADKIDPSHEWNTADCEPSQSQMGNLLLKRSEVANQFNAPLDSVMFCSTVRGYRLRDLVVSMLRRLPDEKKAHFFGTPRQTCKVRKQGRRQRQGSGRGFGEQQKKWQAKHGIGF